MTTWHVIVGGAAIIPIMFFATMYACIQFDRWRW